MESTSAISLTIEFVTLQKRLNASWSSGSVSRTLTSALLDDVYSNFAKMEKKIKMRIMLSLLGLDANKKQELSKSIKRLLKLASSDDKSSEMWVAVTAGLVYERLFGLGADDMEGVCDSAKSMLSETTETTLKQLIDLARMESTASDSTFYFQPLEFCFLSSSLTSRMDEAESNENGHFSYCGTTPDLLAREKERQKNDQRDKAPMNSGLMRVKNDSSQQSSSSISSSSAGRGNIASLAARRTSIVASQGTSTIHRGPAKMISIDEIKIKEAAKKESEAPTLPPPPPQETDEEMGKQGKEKEHKEKKRKAQKEDAQKVEKKPKTATATVGGGASTGAGGAVAEEKSSVAEANKEPDLSALFAESPSLSEDDKKTLTAYFSEDWTTHFADAIAKNEKTRRILLKEEVTDGGKAFYYFHLIFEGHTWKKTKKSKSVE